MKKRYILIVIMGILLFPFTVNAAGSASISANDTVTNGNKVKATLNLKNVAAWNIKIEGTGATDGCSTREVGDSGSGNNINKSFSVECKATSLGTITFTYSGDITSADGSNTNINGSKKVTVVKPRDKSTNNNLKSLTVEGYSLTPSFNKATLEYSVEVESTVEKVNIKAEKEDGYASLDGTGEKEITDGGNKFEITVTSETGSKKVYTINISTIDSNPIIKEVNGESYKIVKKASLLTQPSEDFVETTITIDDVEIPGFKNENTEVVLVGAKDENGKIELYIYDQISGNISKFETLTGEQLTIIIEKPVEELENYSKVKIEINNKEYEAYQIDDILYLIYGKSIRNNKENWYLYNDSEKTIQSYTKELYETKEVKEHKTEKNTDSTVGILVLSGLSLFLLAITVYEVLSKRRLVNEIQMERLGLGIKDEEFFKENEEMIITKKVKKEPVKEETKKVEKEIKVKKVETPVEEKKEVVEKPKGKQLEELEQEITESINESKKEKKTTKPRTKKTENKEEKLD